MFLSQGSSEVVSASSSRGGHRQYTDVKALLLDHARKEFFEDALREMNNQLFEGEDERRVPKKDVGLELLFEVAGMLLGHSILQGGPAFPCLSASIFDYLSHGDVGNCCMSSHCLSDQLLPMPMWIPLTQFTIQDQRRHTCIKNVVPIVSRVGYLGRVSHYDNE